MFRNVIINPLFYTINLKRDCLMPVRIIMRQRERERPRERGERERKREISWNACKLLAGMSNGTTDVGSSMEDPPRTLATELHMTQQSHFWVLIQNN
jgi:hypothetical protein